MDKTVRRFPRLGPVLLTFGLLFFVNCKPVQQQELNPEFGNGLSSDSYAASGEYIPPVAVSADLAPGGFGLTQCNGTTCNAGSGGGAAVGSGSSGSSGGTQTTSGAAGTTSGASAPKSFDQWPGGNGNFAEVKDSSGKAFYQAYDSGTQSWRTTRDASVVGKPFGSNSNAFATWNGTNAGNDWRVTQYARTQGENTIFQSFDEKNNPYNNTAKSWTNFNTVNSQFDNQFKQVSAGNYQLGNGFQYTRSLGNGLFGVPTGQNNQFALAQGQFNPAVRSGQLQDQRWGVPVFTPGQNGATLSGAYLNQENNFSNFGQMQNNFFAPDNGSTITNWGDIGAALGQMFRS